MKKIIVFAVLVVLVSLGCGSKEQGTTDTTTDTQKDTISVVEAKKDTVEASKPIDTCTDEKNQTDTF